MSSALDARPYLHDKMLKVLSGSGTEYYCVATSTKTCFSVSQGRQTFVQRHKRKNCQASTSSVVKAPEKFLRLLRLLFEMHLATQICNACLLTVNSLQSASPPKLLSLSRVKTGSRSSCHQETHCQHIAFSLSQSMPMRATFKFFLQ